MFSYPPLESADDLFKPIQDLPLTPFMQAALYRLIRGIDDSLPPRKTGPSFRQAVFKALSGKRKGRRTTAPIELEWPGNALAHLVNTTVMLPRETPSASLRFDYVSSERIPMQLVLSGREFTDQQGLVTIGKEGGYHLDGFLDLGSQAGPTLLHTSSRFSKPRWFQAEVLEHLRDHLREFREAVGRVGFDFTSL